MSSQTPLDDHKVQRALKFARAALRRNGWSDRNAAACIAVVMSYFKGPIKEEGVSERTIQEARWRFALICVNNHIEGTKCPGQQLPEYEQMREKAKEFVSSKR